MSRPTPTERYNGVAITLHWLIAFALGGMIALGKNMHTSDGRPVEWMFQLHKSVGITILVLMIARVIWRIMNKPPALPDGMKPLEAKASHWVHIGLYALVILLPLSGWIMVSVSPFAIATVLFGTVGWPHLPILAELPLETRQALYPKMEDIHELLSWTLIALFAAHVLGAIKHELSDEEGVLKRMIPGLFGKTTPPRAPARGTLAAFGSAALFFGLIAGGPVVAQALNGPAPAVVSDGSANWSVDYETSEIAFSGIHDGNEFSGVFEDWSADIYWNKNTLAENTVSVSVTTGSAKTGDTLYDNTAAATEWFNTSAFPTASVALSNFRVEGDGLVGDAAVTIKEQTVTLPFTFTITYPNEQYAVMTGNATINRQALDLGQDSDAGGDWVSPDINVSVSVKASRLPS